MSPLFLHGLRGPVGFLRATIGPHLTVVCPRVAVCD